MCGVCVCVCVLGEGEQSTTKFILEDMNTRGTSLSLERHKYCKW